MALPCFYHPDLKAQSLVELSREEASHAIKSRRLKQGDSVALIDGKGSYAFAKIEVCERNKLVLEVSNLEIQKASSSRIKIATALPKGDRAKLMVDMLTQLGVDEIMFLRTERSVSSLSANLVTKLQRTALEACKQSQRAHLPILGEEMLSLEQVIEAHKETDLLVLADKTDSNDWQITENQNILVLIGPEGGFSESEIQLLRSHVGESIQLGAHILRTETAAIAAAALMKSKVLM